MADELTYYNVVEVLLARVPELRPVYQHLLDLEGSPIDQYNLIANAARYAEGVAPQAPSDPQVEDMLQRLAALLEEMASDYDDHYLPDLMGAGFVEAMNPDAPGFAYLVSLMGPASRAQVVSWFGPDAM